MYRRGSDQLKVGRVGRSGSGRGAASCRSPLDKGSIEGLYRLFVVPGGYPDNDVDLRGPLIDDPGDWLTLSKLKAATVLRFKRFTILCDPI